MSGEIYRLFVESFQENPGTPRDWASFKALNRAAREGRLENLPPIGFSFPQENDVATSVFGQDLTEGVDSLPPSTNSIALERRFGGLVSWVLGLHAILIDTASRYKLMAVDQAVTDAAYALKQALGNRQVLVIEEMATANRWEVSNSFKPWVTAEKVLASDKFIRPHLVRTLRGIFTLTNHAVPASLEKDDRRNAVFRIDAPQMPQPYYELLWDIGLKQAACFKAWLQEISRLGLRIAGRR